MLATRALKFNKEIRESAWGKMHAEWAKVRLTCVWLRDEGVVISLTAEGAELRTWRQAARASTMRGGSSGAGVK
jgi:hypothetical protein